MIQRTIHIAGLQDKNTDFAYWQQRAPQERLAALEEIRMEYNTWKYATEQGFQRVCRVIKSK